MRTIFGLFILIIFFFSCGNAKQSYAQNSLEVSHMLDDSTYPEGTYNNTSEEIIEQTDMGAAMSELTVDDSPPSELLYPIESYSEKDNESTFSHEKWDALLKKYVSENGKVNYTGFLNEWGELRSYLFELDNNPPKDDWGRQEKLAFWINAYNAYTIDLILRNFPLNSIKDIKDPWDQRLWKIGDKWYTLNQIEHDILRKMNEPRIHFSIVCASLSCPDLKSYAYKSSDIETQLTMVTEEFLSDPTKNIISENEVQISKIFQWFAKDFKQDGSLIDFLNKYTETNIADNAKVKFLNYNWALND